MNHAIITENDSSKWRNITGVLYPFPNKYSKILTKGTKVIYYKGKLTENEAPEQRLTPKPHYFGMAEIGSIYPDSKKESYAKIENYIHFSEPILAKQASGHIEEIPENRIKNYWWDGVRAISEDVYKAIIEKLSIEDMDRIFGENKVEEDPYFTSYRIEGKKGYRYSSYYERIAANRDAALAIHGCTCFACGFNFADTYGDLGKDFIHVHHIHPISTTGEIIINPETDLIPLCPNCHSMVHRDKERTLSLEELKGILVKTAELRNVVM